MNGRLFRSRDDRMLAGVAGGLAELWDADPSLIRIIWAVLVVLTGGIALVVYIVMAIVVPEEDELAGQAAFVPGTPPPSPAGSAGGPESGAPVSGWDASAPASGWVSPYDAGTGRRETRAARRTARRAGRGRGTGAAPAFIGVLLVLVGVWFLVREYLPTIDFDWFWPLVLIALGVLVLVMAIDRKPRQPGGPTPGSESGQ